MYYKSLAFYMKALTSDWTLEDAHHSIRLCFKGHPQLYCYAVSNRLRAWTSLPVILNLHCAPVVASLRFSLRFYMAVVHTAHELRMLQFELLEFLLRSPHEG